MDENHSFRCAPVLNSTNTIESNLCSLTPSLAPQNYPVSFRVSINNVKAGLLGRGTYGVVHTGISSCNDYEDANISAFKTFLGKDGTFLSQTILRELVPLCSLPAHANVLKPRLVFLDDKNRVHFSSEKMKCNLHDRLKASFCTLEQKKKWSIQLMNAVKHMHQHGFLHRDIKLENVFLDENDDAVLGDLGMSRFGSESVMMSLSSGVCTLWTRAPELCAHATDGKKNGKELVYNVSVDSWSVGITLLSIFSSRYFLQGTDEETMLKLIFSIFGKPSKDSSWDSNSGRETRNSKSVWKSACEHTMFSSDECQKVETSILMECSRRRITVVDQHFVRSILTLLRVEPEQRGTVDDVLNHPFWRVDIPMPIHAKVNACYSPPTAKLKKNIKWVDVTEHQLLYWSQSYYKYTYPSKNVNIEMKDTTSDDDVYSSCTTRGVLRSAVTQWILSLQKSLDLLPLSIMDSILLWERIRDQVDVSVKDEMLLAAACCSLVSKIHEYTPFSSQTWIRCLSSSVTVNDLQKYEILVLRTCKCNLLTFKINVHPIFSVQTEKDAMLLCQYVAKNHTEDIDQSKLLSHALESSSTEYTKNEPS